jgi:hypothetical protein
VGAVVVDCDAEATDEASVADPNLGIQLAPEEGPTIDGIVGDGMAKSLGEVLGAVPDDCELADATDADD